MAEENEEPVITIHIDKHFHKLGMQLLEIDVPKRLWKRFLEEAQTYTKPQHIYLAEERANDLHYQVQCPAFKVGSFIVSIMSLASRDLEETETGDPYDWEEPPALTDELVKEISKIIEESEQ